jgi:hypothetical protein
LQIGLYFYFPRIANTLVDITDITDIKLSDADTDMANTIIDEIQFPFERIMAKIRKMT